MGLKRYKVAVIGCGRIAGHHCRSIADMEAMEMVGACDLEEEKAAAWGKEFNIPHYTNYHEMLTTIPDVDIVAIITPSGMHWEHGIDVMKRYKKHVIIEKPTFMRPSQLIDAYQVADSLGLHIFPAFQNRYNLAVQRVKKGIEAGELGKIRLVGVRVRWCRPDRYYNMAPWRGTYAQDGGALTNQGIHHVDLLRYFAGEVNQVNATMRTLGASIEVEDSVVATFKYNSKVIGSLEVTTAARPDDYEASLSIVGSEGLAQLGGIAVNELQIYTPDPTACQAQSEDFSGCVYGNGHTAMYRDIASFFIDGKPYPVCQEDCLKTIKLLHAFYRSDEAGTWVEVDSDVESTRLGAPDEALADLYRTPLPKGLF